MASSKGLNYSTKGKAPPIQQPPWIFAEELHKVKLYLDLINTQSMNYRCWPLPLLGMDQRVPLRWWEQEKMVRNWNDPFCNFQEFQRCFNRLFWRSIVVSTLTLKGRFICVSFIIYLTLKLVWRWYLNCFLNYICFFQSRVLFFETACSYCLFVHS